MRESTINLRRLLKKLPKLKASKQFMLRLNQKIIEIEETKKQKKTTKENGKKATAFK